MQEALYWTIRVLMIALSICIVRLVWLEAGQAFEKEWEQMKNQLRQQLALTRDTIFWT